MVISSRSDGTPTLMYTRLVHASRTDVHRESTPFVMSAADGCR